MILKSSRSGFTIIEALLSIVIVAVSIFGLLRAFEYGGFFLEREGLRRQALGLVQMKLEELKHQSKFGKNHLSSHSIEEADQLQRMFFKQNVFIPANMRTEVGELESENGFKFQDVAVSVFYKYQNVPDTLTIQTRFYLWAGN